MKVPAIYKFIRDMQGNVSKLYLVSPNSTFAGTYECLVGEYDYDSFGNCKVTAYDVNGNVIANPDATHIANLNPFRWKGHYRDSETGMYYINGRYYSPELGHYLDADDPENLLSAAFLLNALDRNAATLDNMLNFAANDDTIFTAGELAVDPYDYNADKSWWEVNWRKVVGWFLFVISVLTSIFTFGIGGTLAILAIGGAIGGAVANARGSDFWEGVVEGMLWGMTVALVLYSVVTVLHSSIIIKNKNGKRI